MRFAAQGTAGFAHLRVTKCFAWEAKQSIAGSTNVGNTAGDCNGQNSQGVDSATEHR